MITMMTTVTMITLIEIVMHMTSTLLVMSMKELRAIMKARGLSTDGLLEKTEFVDAICAHAAEPPP